MVDFTKAKRRSTFNENEADSGEPIKRGRTLYPCAGNGCKMPGVIFRSESSDGLCALHYTENGRHWHLLNQILKDWDCVVSEINACRAAHCNPDYITAPKVLSGLFAAAWQRLEPLTPGWDSLKPKEKQDYKSWGQRLEQFLHERVKESLHRVD